MTDRAESDNGIDFARFLSIWLFELKMPEADFWQSMNPARLCSLFSAYFRPKHQREAPHSLQTGVKPGFSLYSYLTGMGG